MHQLTERKFWLEKKRLEEAILQEKGDFDNFLEKNEFDELLYNQLKICGGAYVLADKAQNELLLLQRKELQKIIIQEHKGMPFIEIPYKYKYSSEKKKEASRRKKITSENRIVLDAMQIGTRDKQPLFDDNKSSPEFYLNLPHLQAQEGLDKLLPFEKKLVKDGFKMIYCTVGEVLFHLFAWRLLFRYGQWRGLKEEEDSVVSLDDDVIQFKYQYDFWEEITTFENMPGSDWLKALEELYKPNQKITKEWAKIRQKDIDTIKRKKTYSFYDEYWYLGLTEEKGETAKVTRPFLALVRYAIYIAETHLGWSKEPAKRYDVEEKKRKTGFFLTKEEVLLNLYILERRLDIYFQEPDNKHKSYTPNIDSIKSEFLINYCLRKVISAYLFNKKISLAEDNIKLRDEAIEHIIEGEKEETKEEIPVANKREKKIIDLLQELAKKARFPIIPYFYELIQNDFHEPKEHLSFCIWDSAEQKIPVKRIDGSKVQDQGVVFLLLTIHPIWKINPKFNFIKHGKSIHCMETLSDAAFNRIFRIYDFFSFLARPIIDRAFYNGLLKKEIEKNFYKTDINAFSHELSKIISNIFDTSNISVEYFFKQKMNKALAAVRPFMDEGMLYEARNIKDWLIIPSPERFKIWSLMLSVWAGQRGQQIFDLEEHDSIDKIISECDKLSQKMSIGEKFSRFEKIDSLKKLKKYEDGFDEQLKQLNEHNRLIMRYDSADIEHLKLRGLDNLQGAELDKMIYEQNALLRVLLAALTNIYEHTKGDFIFEIKWKIPNKILSFSIINPCEKIDVEPKESFGTKPVLKSCLSLLGGELLKFRTYHADNYQENIEKEKWMKQLNLHRTELDIWITQFIIPINKLFIK